MTEVAFITGITGQDGSYLTELLLRKGYEVHGMVRRSSSIERSRLAHLYSDAAVYEKRLFLHYADLSDTNTIRRLVTEIRPDEFYHLAGQSHVGLSFEIPESTCELTAMATLRILEILRELEHPPKFLHASSREIFGTPEISPQDENTPVNPESPYGVAKAFATQLTGIYREVHGMFCCNSIAYNHESPRRGENFVSRKISIGAAAIKLGLKEHLVLGDIDARRDWGDAREFVVGMWMMLQHPQPEDFVFASGRSHSVQDLLEYAFDHIGMDWRKHVKIDERYKRPKDVARVCGDPTKARKLLGWQGSSSPRALMVDMVSADLCVLSEQSART